MMTATLRRLSLIIIAIAVSAALLHRELSSALVWRGDTLAYWGDSASARGAYRRALFFDSSNGVAADRLVFSEAISHVPMLLRDGASDASAFLRGAPSNDSVRFDRALCYQKLGDLALAAADFEAVGNHARSVRALMFAALDRGRLGERRRSRSLLRLALMQDPQFAPARDALARVSR